MSYWLLDGLPMKSPVLPYLTPGSTESFTLTFYNEDSSTWLRCSLFTSSRWSGLIEARKTGSGADYLPLSIQGDPQCYIAHLAPGETDIDFRLSVPSDEEVALYQIPIGIAHDTGASKPSFYLTAWLFPVWAPCLEISPVWWDTLFREETECPAPEAPTGFASTFGDGFTDDISDTGWTDSL